MILLNIFLYTIIILIILIIMVAIRNPKIYAFRTQTILRISKFITRHNDGSGIITSEMIYALYLPLHKPSDAMMMFMIHKWSYASFYGDLEERLQNILLSTPSTTNKENTMTNTNSTTSTNTEETLDFDHSIVEYIRGEKNHPKGMLMAVIDRKDDRIHIGWSLTRSGSKDMFIKDRAYDITMGRVVLADVHKVTIPFELLDERSNKFSLMENFVLRAKKYFHSDKVTVFGRVRKEIPGSSQLEYVQFQHS